MRHRSNLSKTLDYVRNLKAGNHGIFFYRNPHEKHEVLFNFLKAGLEKEKGAIYVASQETSKQIRSHMEDFGLNVKALEKDGALRIVDYYDWYIIDGKVNASHATESALRVFDEAAEIGLKGLCGCGEVACFFEHKKEKELVEYELTLGRKFDLPITGLCAYDVNHAKSLVEKLFFSLIKAHGVVVTSSFARKIKFEKFFPIVMDEVLETVFGKIGKETILRTLDKRHSPKPLKTAEDAGSFIDGLEEIIGSGAQVITKWAVREMYSRMGITQRQTSVRKIESKTEESLL
jgi:hypothetical protein